LAHNKMFVMGKEHLLVNNKIRKKLRQKRLKDSHDYELL